MKFITKTVNHQESDCGKYLISMAQVAARVVYTLTSGGQILAQESCVNFVQERKDALSVLHEFAEGHKNGIG